MANIIFIPAYNEIKTIKKVVSDVIEAMQGDCLVWLYDNGSNDGTWNEMIKLTCGENHARITISRVRDRGKGNVYKAFREDALKYGGPGDKFAMIDADNTYGVKILPLLFHAVGNSKDKAVMVIGDRISYYEEPGNMVNKTGNKFLRKMVKKVWKVDADILSGCRVFSWEFIEGFIPKGDGFTLETEMTLWAIKNNGVIKSYPCGYVNRTEGHSKIRPVKDGM